MNTAPRTAREALIAEILGDLDQLLTRADAIPARILAAEKNMENMVAKLDSAGDRYRMAITVFNEQAKADLLSYHDRKMVDTVSRTTEELRVAVQGIALQAFRSEAFDKSATLGLALGEAAKEFRRSMWSRLVEHGITSLAASLITASLVYGIVRIH